jgi:hypothetical protein
MSCLKEVSCLIYVICVWLRIVVSNTYFVACFFFFVLCTLCCQFLLIVHFWLALRYSLTFIESWFCSIVSFRCSVSLSVCSFAVNHCIVCVVRLIASDYPFGVVFFFLLWFFFKHFWTNDSVVLNNIKANINLFKADGCINIGSN